MAHVARRREALRDRQPRSRVAAVEDVVLALRSPGEAADAVDLTERSEAVEPAGQQLVGVGLVAGVPDDPVARRVEDPVQGDRQLDDAERLAEVAAGLRDGRDDGLPDLGGEGRELTLGQAAQVARAVQAGKDRGHVSGGSHSARVTRDVRRV
jgi:hypothetical protein